VEASFVSDEGHWATTISEAVWGWLQQPDVAWNSIQRISPWSACEVDPSRCRSLDEALFTALDFPNPESSLAPDLQAPRPSLSGFLRRGLQSLSSPERRLTPWEQGRGSPPT
jgi:hypothetical protein